jgi:alkylation response protein AidB-like acyl-CoA dehydrogenase
VDFAYRDEDEAFRAELQAWLDANLPEFMDSGEIGDHADDASDPVGAVRRTMARRQAWQQRLHAGRWAAINWPVARGGREATTMQNVIYAEVMARAKTPGVYNANGIWQIGPMILRWGTEEQQQRWLPGILDASEHWCQGFSEPEAGSDLANLRTTAIRDGDEYLVNGTKIWTSTAHLATWGLFLVRTDPDAIARGAKHEGITALIVDLRRPGIQCNPIREITGEAMFCEVVFTDARVPAAYRLGGEGEGWTVAMGTLTHERVGTGGLAIGMKAELEQMIAAAREHNPDALDDPGQPPVLLLLGAPPQDHRADLPEPVGVVDARGLRGRHHLGVDDVLHRGGLAPAPLAGPVDRRPAALVEPLLPRLAAGHRATDGAHRVGSVVGLVADLPLVLEVGQVRVQPRLQLGPEGLVLGLVGEVHRRGT